MVLAVSLDNFNNQVHHNKVASQLEAYSTEVLHEKQTADTSDRMDISRSVAPEELQELIAKSTAKAMSSLTREIQSLKAKLDNQTSNKTPSS